MLQIISKIKDNLQVVLLLSCFVGHPVTEYISQIDKNTDRTLDVFFSRFRGFSFILTIRQRPKVVTRMHSLCLVIQRCLRGTPLGFCLRASVKENPFNLEKTTSSILSVLFLIYDIYLSTECTIPYFFSLSALETKFPRSKSKNKSCIVKLK